MKEFLTMVRRKEIWEPLMVIGAVLMLIVIILPIARIMTFCVPWYDDFGYGLYTKNFWSIKHSLIDLVNGVWYTVKTMWYAWQGTYTSCLLMSLMPAIWGTDKYVFGLWAILIVLILGIFSLTGVLVKKILKYENRSYIFFLQAVIAAMVILFMGSAVEGFFWYNSAVHYTAMHGFGMLLLSGMIKLALEENWGRRIALTIICALGGFFVAGGNNVTVLQMGLVALTVVFLAFLLRRKNAFWLIPTIISYGIGMKMNLLSPGNAKRMVYFESMKTTPVKAIFESFHSAFTYLPEFTGWRTLAMILLAMPVILCIVSKTKFRFRYPLIILLWSFCLYATGFTPTLYTMGHTLLGRATNMAKVTFQLLMFLNIIYFTGWTYQKIVNKEKLKNAFSCSWVYYILVCLFFVGIFAVEPNKGGKYVSYCAYYFVHTGEAYNYYHEYLDRVELMSGPEKDVEVLAYGYKPWLLCLGDLSEDPNYEPNRFMATFFGKEHIICVPR